MSIEIANVYTSSYGNWTVETEILYRPISSEIQQMLRKYRAIRVMLMSGESSPVLVGCPASVCDHGCLARYFADQGFKPMFGSFYHIVNHEPHPFLTLDGFYDTSELIDWLAAEFADSEYDNERIANTKLLLEMLPDFIDKSYVIAAMQLYIDGKVDPSKLYSLQEV